MAVKTIDDASDEYEFTTDWFNWAPPLWLMLKEMLPPNPDCLEIGSFEGRSMVWMVENLLGEAGTLTCVDSWQGGEEHGEFDMDAVYNRFLRNRDRAMRKRGWDPAVHWSAKSVGVMRCPSLGALVGFVSDNELFDFIYIDGSHKAKDVLTDAVLSWAALRENGLLVFDDYAWGQPRDILHRPKLAIDAFTNIFAEEAEIVHVGYQLVVRKRSK